MVEPAGAASRSLHRFLEKVRVDSRRGELPANVGAVHTMATVIAGVDRTGGGVGSAVEDLSEGRAREQVDLERLRDEGAILRLEALEGDRVRVPKQSLGIPQP